mmetsp:Transcript_71178/g.63896  ORF Transcript_71178/g.63896 Transcript_71178/m.63896 type:complete len:174 (-) Transcript_71178:178-699(-)|eukprot:CAMPEP_0201583196 /NCGR_PEP_ID=MMETSP0190_2-20130828/95641_1 /ASSEMBLY_ACC=CAM_ASM_000263 /TAXON_ID=37353 /ORGANISM="Rosalina sp." /LENGTH=173 /DNA_ID=CAMNT_0048024635 /DNA_START=73 /DNA_END=594 /DNA_ORIENTATION=-
MLLLPILLYSLLSILTKGDEPALVKRQLQESSDVTWYDGRLVCHFKGDIMETANKGGVLGDMGWSGPYEIIATSWNSRDCPEVAYGCMYGYLAKVCGWDLNRGYAILSLIVRDLTPEGTWNPTSTGQPHGMVDFIEAPNCCGPTPPPTPKPTSLTADPTNSPTTSPTESPIID